MENSDLECGRGVDHAADKPENRRKNSLLSRLFSNFACPRGAMGRVALSMMNCWHGPLTNWGLGYVPFQDGWTILDVGCGGGQTLKRLLGRSRGAIAIGERPAFSRFSIRQRACSSRCDICHLLGLKFVTLNAQPPMGGACIQLQYSMSLPVCKTERSPPPYVTLNAQSPFCNT